jgi:hypothetical protein
MSRAAKWQECEASHPALRVVRNAAQAVAMLRSNNQALLHIWCALEPLFPKVSTEVSFRVSLNLAQLSSTSGERIAFFERVKKAYNVRSRVADGSEKQIGNTVVLDARGC